MGHGPLRFSVYPPAAIVDPSGLIATAYTAPTFSGPTGIQIVLNSLPSASDQILTVRSTEPVTAKRPSASTASDQIAPVCTPGSTASTGRSYRSVPFFGP